MTYLLLLYFGSFVGLFLLAGAYQYATSSQAREKYREALQAADEFHDPLEGIDTHERFDKAREEIGEDPDEPMGMMGFYATLAEAKNIDREVKEQQKET